MKTLIKKYQYPDGGIEKADNTKVYNFALLVDNINKRALKAEEAYRDLYWQTPDGKIANFTFTEGPRVEAKLKSKDPYLQLLHGETEDLYLDRIEARQNQSHNFTHNINFVLNTTAQAIANGAKQVTYFLPGIGNVVLGTDVLALIANGDYEGAALTLGTIGGMKLAGSLVRELNSIPTKNTYSSPKSKIRIRHSSHTKANPREFVLEPLGNNKYYIHMRTWDGEKLPANISNEVKQGLFDSTYEALPEGSEILVPKSGKDFQATRGTIAGLKRLSKDSRFTAGEPGVVWYDNKGTLTPYETTSFIKKGLETTNASVGSSEEIRNISIPEELEAAKAEAVAGYKNAGAIYNDPNYKERLKLLFNTDEEIQNALKELIDNIKTTKLKLSGLDGKMHGKHTVNHVRNSDGITSFEHYAAADPRFKGTNNTVVHEVGGHGATMGIEPVVLTEDGTVKVVYADGTTDRFDGNGFLVDGASILLGLLYPNSKKIIAFDLKLFEDNLKLNDIEELMRSEIKEAHPNISDTALDIATKTKMMGVDIPYAKSVQEIRARLMEGFGDYIDRIKSNPKLTIEEFLNSKDISSGMKDLLRYYGKDGVKKVFGKVLSAGALGGLYINLLRRLGGKLAYIKYLRQ